MADRIAMKSWEEMSPEQREQAYSAIFTQKTGRKQKSATKKAAIKALVEKYKQEYEGLIKKFETPAPKGK